MTQAPQIPDALIPHLSSPLPEDEGFMRLALEQARLAYGRTSPNPMVGAVLVRDGEVIGVGHHARAGASHAEVEALRDARGRGHDPAGATLYVTLEPCCVHGRTPPCTEAVLGAGVSRVVAATLDPDARMRGAGMGRLAEAGLEICLGVEGEAARRLNAPFNTRALLGRPHVTVKVAMSLDGRIAARNGESFPLTGPEARQAVHVLRDRIDAICVGRRTVERDDPQLTCRLPETLAGPGGPSDPVRVILDPAMRLPTTARIFHLQAQGRSTAPTWLVVARGEEDADKVRTLDALGVEVIGCPRGPDGALALGWLLSELAGRGLCSLLVEGGGQTLGHFFEAGLVDAWIAHVAPALIGGTQTPGPLGGLGAGSLAEITRLGSPRMRRLGDDIEIAAPVVGDVYGID